MTHSNEAYSRLRGITLEDLTTEQMDSVLGPSSISPNINGQFEQAQMLAGALTAQRTYCGGVLPIPEAGSVTVALIEALGTGLIQPSGTEIWDIKSVRCIGMLGAATAEIVFTDGTEDCILYSASNIPTAGATIDFNDAVSAPMLLTNSLYIKITETGGNYAIQLQVAYQVVSL